MQARPRRGSPEKKKEKQAERRVARKNTLAGFVDGWGRSLRVGPTVSRRFGETPKEAVGIKKNKT